MCRSLKSLILIACMVIVVGRRPVSGQQSASKINGLVTDTSGAILPGAAVEVEQNGLKAVSDAQGQFTISNVAPGTYTLKVSYVGFSTFQMPVTVTGGQPANVTAVLLVASDSESILVTAERAPLPVWNQNVPSSHRAPTAVTCGLPSSLRVDSQVVREFTALSHGAGSIT